MSYTIGRVLLPVMVLAAIGCSDASGPSNAAATSRLIFSVSSGSPSAGPVAAAETVTLGSDVLVLSQVDLVVRQIELNRAGAAAGCDSTADGSPSASQENESEHHGGHDGVARECEEVELGPLLVTLPLGGGTVQQIEVQLAPGTYDRVQFQVHKPDNDNAGDGTFLAAHPDFRQVSIRARGTFNGTAFEFVSDLSAQQELALSPPLVLAQDSTASVSLTVDVSGWFLDTSHSHLINPATALKGQPNEGMVEQNIKKSLRARGYYGRDG